MLCAFLERITFSQLLFHYIVNDFTGFLDCFLFPVSEYLDESMLIPKNTSVLIRRVPGRPRMPIVTAPVPEPDEYRLVPFSLFFLLGLVLLVD